MWVDNICVDNTFMDMQRFFLYFLAAYMFH